MNLNNTLRVLVTVTLVIPLLLLLRFTVLLNSLAFKKSALVFFIVSLFYIIFSISYLVRVFK